jgi:hypothetical protein
LHCCLFFAFCLCFAIVKSTGTGKSTGKEKENQGQKEKHRKSTGKKVLLQPLLYLLFFKFDWSKATLVQGPQVRWRES